MNELTGSPEFDDEEQELTPEEQAEQAEAEERQADLETLLRSPLVVGPDPTVINDLLNENEPEVKRDPTEELAEQAELDAKVERIYANIAARAPEFKIQPSTQRVVDCLEFMGNPQNQYRAIHIAGTNGKTSTARMVEAVLRERGLRTGLYTSPHLSTVRERIVVDGEPISPTLFVQAWEDVAPFVALVDAQSAANGGPAMSFFEVFTVMAFAAFADAPIDVAIVEVGMGGLWDATNVIDADVAVITPVAQDHQQWLGSEIEDIAREKLGIVKDHATVVSAEQESTVADILRETVRDRHARLIAYGENLEVLDRETAVGGQLLSLRTPSAVYEDIPLAMLGAHQARNAALAVAAVESFFGGQALSGDVVEHALMATSSPGRMEVLRSSPFVIADGAHNPAGVRAAVDALEEYFPGTKVAVFSAMGDKDVEGMLNLLESAVHSVVITQMDGVRAGDAHDLAKIARDVFGDDRVAVEPHLESAIVFAADVAETVDPDEVTKPSVVVIGSIQLAAEARAVLKGPGSPRDERS